MILNLVIAFLLDVLLGDPQWFPHPVRGIGRLIQKLESVSRKHITNEFAAGQFGKEFPGPIPRDIERAVYMMWIVTLLSLLGAITMRIVFF